ncbi:hypothetical protein BH20ACI1_BH20ACI1_19710 [soil metagenome]
MSNSIENLLEPRADKNGRLFIKGTRISVNFIARFWRMGIGAEEIIEDYEHLAPEGVYAALTYYFANREELDAEIDAEIEEERRLIKEHKRSNREKELLAA